MPLGNGNLFLSVKAEIRKIIKKQAPEVVHIILYENKAPIIIPEEILLCMEYEEEVLIKFKSYTDGQKKTFIDWINSAKTENTKVNRIAKTIAMIQNGKKFYDKVKRSQL